MRVNNTSIFGLYKHRKRVTLAKSRAPLFAFIPAFVVGIFAGAIFLASYTQPASARQICGVNAVECGESDYTFPDLTSETGRESTCTSAGGEWSGSACSFEEPVYILEGQIKRHLFYRGMWACFSDGFEKYSLTVNDVNEGKWNPKRDKKGIGYLAYSDGLDWDDKDGTQDCDDGNYITKGSTTIGFRDPLDMLCSMNRTDAGGYLIDPNNNSDCEESSDFKTINFYDDKNDNDLSKALTAAIKDSSAASAPWSMQDIKVNGDSRTGAAYYLLMRRSLEAFCGKDHASLSEAGDFDNDDNYVIVDQVAFATGEIYGKGKAYRVGFDGRKDSAKVDDVYWAKGNNGDEANDYKCSEMASATRTWSGSFSDYIVRESNKIVATNAKVSLTIDENLRTKEPQCKSASEDSCNKLITATWIAAVDKCRDSAELDVTVDLTERRELMNTCLKKALPARYDTAVDSVADVNVKGADEDITGNGDSDEGTSCAIDGIGWIICPVMNFLAEANEKAFGFLQTLLSIPPSLTTDPATVTAWSRFRDLANIAFVIAFLVIIYSQITSVGISNYGIKKLLPKIAAAAILVNLSLFICQVLVDASNIAGAGLYSFTTGIVQLDPTQANGGSWTSIMTGLLAVGVGVLLIVAIIAAPTVLLALGLILLILIARQAFILILVVIAPLAFVAYLLPNTEGLFKKWWKALSATLLVYPIIGMIFGASTLASNILMQIASGGSGDDKQLLAIVALAVMAIPLFAVPAVLKGAMSGAGAIGAKLSNLQDRANRRASGDVKNRAGAELKDLGNRFTNRALNSTGRRGAAARFVSGVGRRAKRDDRYKQNQTLRDAAQEDFLNQGIDVNDPTNTQGLSKTAQRRVAAGSAKKTADTRNQVINNLGAQSSMSNNAALYRAAANSSEATHHQEDTLKNQGKADYYNDHRNDGHLAENIAARENSQAAETGATNRVKTGITPGSVEARQAITANKAAKGEEKIIDQGLELDFQKSDIGRSQVQGLKAVEGELEIEHGEQKNVFEGSVVGKTQAQQKKVIQGTAKVIEGEVELAYQTSDIGKVLEESNLGAQALVQNAKIATDLAYQKSDAGKAANVGGAVVQAQLDAAKTANSAVIDELKAGVSANGFDDPNSPNYIADTTDPTYQAAVDLSAADIDTKAQRQRQASAQGVANAEYAKQVAASENVAGGLAEVAGGIDDYGARRAVSAATQVAIEQFNKNVATEKSTMTSMDQDEWMAIVQNPNESDERRAAAAGKIMQGGSMKSIHDLYNYTMTMDASQSGSRENIQMQMGGDIGREPFGMGDTDASALRRGGLTPDTLFAGMDPVRQTAIKDKITNPTDTSAPITHYDVMLGKRAEKKMGPQALVKMDPDDRRRYAELIENAASGGDAELVIDTAGRQNIIDAIRAVASNETTKGIPKTDAKNDYNRILRALGQAEMTEADWQ